MAANSPPLPPYGATITTLLTTTISLSSSQSLFTVLNPPPGTGDGASTTFPVTSDAGGIYTPSPLPILVLTNVVGVALDPAGIPIVTRTLSQTAPTMSATPLPEENCNSSIDYCWSMSERSWTFLVSGLGVGFLLILSLLWYWYLYHYRVMVRIGSVGEGSSEGSPHGEEDRPGIRIGVQTSLSQTRSVGGNMREECLTPSPTQGSVKVVIGAQVNRTGADGVGRGRGPTAYRVVRKSTSREFVRSVSIPEGPSVRVMDETEVSDFVVPAGGVGAGAGRAVRAKMGSISEGYIGDAGGKSKRERRGSKRDGGDVETGFEMKEWTAKRSDENHQAKDKEDGKQRRNERGRRNTENEDVSGRKRRNGHSSGNEEDFEVKRARSPRRRHSEAERGGERRE